MTQPTVTLCKQAARFRDRDATPRLGLIVLASDLTTEPDFATMLAPSGAVIHVTRVRNANPVTPANLRAMAGRLTEAAALLIEGVPLRAIYYSCTSASVLIGEAEVVANIQAARPGTPVVTPSGAARHALAALGAGRVAILTPYTVETTEPMAHHFAANGFEVTACQCLGIEDDRDMAHVTGETIVDAARAVDTPETEAIFISCTALPAVGVIAAIEEATGKPVVTSNQAGAWAMTRLGGLSGFRPAGFGRLFDLPMVGAGAGAAA
ncbi:MULTISPECIES: aspartate/glutamate racemase family protein [unclassified Roseitalea]|uniref:aspartate racemase/maleate isomerase family protein n=1 Tax=unclassified Roseitalea TaxID=2639107 RepID=UPI0027401852|nr:MULTISPECIES: aspartate/glutamate racemase family protein [unclassified Roseitalea]